MNTVTFPRSVRALAAVLTLVMLLGLATPAAAADSLGSFLVTAQKSYEIAPGITETELTLDTLQGGAKNFAHMLEIQLEEPTVSVQAYHPPETESGWVLQKPETQAAAVEASLEDAHVVGLVNTNFYVLADGEPLGALVVDGNVISVPYTEWSYFVVHEDGTAEILDGATPIPDDAVQAVSGKHRLVKDGAVQTLSEADKDSSVWSGGSEYRAPRTALGMRSDGTLVLFETDGRQAGGSVGMTFTELAETMAGLGCTEAINLDGGSSSSFMTRRVGDEEITLRNTTSNSGGKTRAIAATLVVISSAYEEAAPSPEPTGTDISTLTVSGISPVYALRNAEKGVCPMPVIQDGEKTLSLDGTDGVVTWENNHAFGSARVVVQGCGDYCGTLELPYQLCPDKAANAHVDRATDTALWLSWSSVPLAEQYVVYQYDYSAGALKEVAVTEGAETSIVLSDLPPLTSWSLCVRARGTADGVRIESYSYDWLYASTCSSKSTAAAVTDVRAQLSDAETIPLQAADGEAYLFLPAYADLTKLPLQFTVASSSEAIRIAGNKGSLTLSSRSETVDLTAIAGKNDAGCYEMDVYLGNRSPMTVHVMRSSIPALFLRSDDAAKGRDYVDASKANLATGTMRLLGADGSVIYDGALTQIKTRGNSTFSVAPKKSYQIKLDKKSDLIGIGEKVKTWVLLAGYGDATQLHDKTMKDLADQLGMPYVPKNDWVDLYYDGIYRGTYLLGEKNSVGKTGVNITDLEEAYEEINASYGSDAMLQKGENRYGQEIQFTLNLDEVDDYSGGWLIELNNQEYDEVSGFKTAQDVAFNVKSPEWAGEAAMKYISEYYQEFENAVYAHDAEGNYTGVNPDTGKHYYEYVDLQSLVQMVLLQDFSGNVDAFHSSLYFYKDAGGILYAGPIWDQDITYGNGWSTEISPDNRFLRSRYLVAALMKIPDFREAIETYYAEQFRPEAAKLTDIIAQLSAKISDSVAMNGKLWPFVRVSHPEKEGHLWPAGTDYPTVIRDMQNWVRQKLAVMDTDYHRDASGDETPTEETPTQTHPSPQDSDALITPTAPAVPEQPFNPDTYDLPYQDVVKDRYYYRAVVWAHLEGVTKGQTADQFGTNSSCTRAQIVTFLWRAAGSPEPKSTKTPFLDVRTSAFYYKAMLWAVEEQITKGTAKDAFSPNDPCTRGQAVTFLWRLAGAVKTDTDNPFSDVPAGKFFTRSVLWAVSNGVTNGTTPTTFEPNGTCTRAQIVTMLYRYFAEQAA